MCQAIENFGSWAEDKGIMVEGLDKCPELRMAEVEYANPWSEDPDDPEIMVAEKMKLTVAQNPDGMINPLNKVSNQYKLVQHYEDPVKET